MSRSTWQIRIDTGGTFTDGVGVGPDGRVRRVKLLSTSALRGRTARRVDGERLALDAAWPWASEALSGLTLRRVGDARALARVVDPS